MSQPTVAQLRTAIVANINAGISFPGQVLDYWLANPSPPCIDVKRGPLRYDLANARGLDEWTFIVRAIYAFTTDQGAQASIDALVSGTYTLKDAIETDKTLGGIADNVRVTQVSDEKAYVSHDGTSYLGAEWTVEVLATGT